MDKKRKVLMIGTRDSGKTTYMVSAYGAMKAGKYGFSVYGDHDTNAWLMSLYSQIQAGQYPLPTEKREQFDFTLYYYQQPVLSFQWVDYLGGILAEGKSPELAGDIDEADAIIIFLDAEILAGNQIADTDLPKILYLISEKLGNTERTFDILTVVTKYDLIGTALPFEEVIRPLDNLRSSLSMRENIHFRIVPVSCTARGFMNVDLPLIDILYSGLKENHDYHLHQSLEQAKLARKYYKGRGPLDWMFSKLFRLKTNGQLAQEAQEASRREQELWKELSTALEQLKAYRENYQIEIPRFAGEYIPDKPDSILITM